MKKLFHAFSILLALFSVSAFAQLPKIDWATLGNSNHLNAQGYNETIKVAGYDDLPLYLVTMKNGVITPLQLIVPPGQAFRILVHNVGTVPAEFESHQLRFEDVLFMQSYSFQKILALTPGTYDYYDDWHPGSKSGEIIVK